MAHIYGESLLRLEVKKHIVADRETIRIYSGRPAEFDPQFPNITASISLECDINQATALDMARQLREAADKLEEIGKTIKMTLEEAIGDASLT
jgi:hypothetical protein